MVSYITKIQTKEGNLPVDYNSLTNLPSFDTTLSNEGQIDDSKVVGDKFNQVNEEIVNINDLMFTDETSKNLFDCDNPNIANVAINESGFTTYDTCKSFYIPISIDNGTNITNNYQINMIL